MDKLKRIEDQIRLQESLIGSLRYQLTQRRPQESYIAITAQLTHALAGLAALCRADEADERSGGEAVDSQLMALPIGALLLTADDVSDEVLTYLETAGIPEPGDDLECIIVADINLIHEEGREKFNNGNPKTYYEWVFKDDQPIAPLIRRLTSHSNDCEWYKIQFADGWKAVGICSH
jgi:hypothetical protein